MRGTAAAQARGQAAGHPAIPPAGPPEPPPSGAGTEPGPPDGTGPRPAAARGRRPATSRERLARAALELFAACGYDETTVEDIAAAVGVSRRTFFRYFESKRDVVWGEFQAELARFEARLAEPHEGEPMMDVLRRAVVATNRFGAGELDELRIRIGLIDAVPTLTAHSAVRYAEWCEVVARFAARRLGAEPDDLAPQVVARAALGAATAAFACWAAGDNDDLPGDLDRAFRMLAAGFDEQRLSVGAAAPPPARQDGGHLRYARPRPPGGEVT